jgi:hypothetical protein
MIKSRMMRLAEYVPHMRKEEKDIEFWWENLKEGACFKDKAYMKA